MTSLGSNLLLVFGCLVAFHQTSGQLTIEPGNPVVTINERNISDDPLFKLKVSPAKSGDILNLNITDLNNCLGTGTLIKEKIKCSDVCEYAIVSKKILDRESVCGTFDLFVKFGITKPFQSKMYRIIFTDVNDNPPQFINLPYKASIKENSTPGPLTQLHINATDADDGYNAAISYALEPAGQNPGNINDTMTINSITGLITLNKSLDYETRNFYQYNVIAKDAGIPSLSTTASVWIQVLDCQDTPPVFIQPSFVIHIEEDTKIGTSVLSVSAEDGDRGVPDEIRYELSGDVCDRFSIDRTSGIISVKQSLNLTIDKLKNKNGVCSITVKAVELHDKTSFTQQNATIFIDDVNDNSPVFTKAKYSGSISEGAKKGNPVTLSEAIKVTDNDLQIENSKFTLSLQHLNGSAFTALEVVPGESVMRAVLTLLVKDVNQLDYEQSHFIEFKIVAQGYKKKHNCSAAVNITILPSNEFRPKFKKNYTTCVLENATKGHEVIKVEATDDDDGTDGNITYSLFGSNGLFSIDKQTGHVTVGSNKLDYEQVQSYNLTVEATDGGNFKGTAQLYVCINDTNDETPTFTSSVYEGTMKENEKFTITIEAKDKDKSGTPNSKVSYEIVDVSQGLHKNFTIDKTTGKIETNSIDNEQLHSNTILLLVEASDEGNPPRSSTANVTIKVRGINDNIPYFLRQNYNFSVPENASTGFNIGKVSADDNDREEINKKLTYILISETDNFRINSGNGNISVLGKLDRETKEVYSLDVKVIDGGTPPNSATATVKITVTDINDEIPKLSYSDNITVSEDCQLKSVITTINASDPDSDSSLSFSISSQRIQIDGKGMFVNTPTKEYFDIDNSNGNIYVKQSLDREKAEVISLEIKVTDMKAVDRLPQVSKGQININILDVNDNAPEFLKKNIKLQLYENIQLDSLITKVSATDADKDDHVTYSFDKNYQQFKIDGTSGEIRLCQKLDRETNETISLLVLAKDTKIPIHSSTATISLTLLDYNDNSPTFNDGLYNKTYDIKEDAEKLHEIVTVTATDADKGINADIRYYLVYRDSDLPICINDTQGMVYVCGKLDREKTSFYNIEIQAKDMRGEHNVEARTGSTWIKINVTDVNDSPPMFMTSAYSASVREDLKVDQSILQVRATDEDIGDNKRIAFSLEGNVSMFKIDQSRGIIKVRLSLIDKVGTETFLVVATDHGSPSLKNSTNVTVTITDMNNHAPKFPEETKNINIPEDTCPNQIIYNVSATDDDIEPKNKQVTYEMKKEKEWEFFHLNEVSGQLKLVKQMDSEKFSSPLYHVRIIAYDNGEPRLTSNIWELVVNATNVDDEPPVFLRKDYPGLKKTFRVPEGKPELYIGTIKVHDSDPSSKLCFEITKQKENHFKVNSSGVIIALKELDYENKKIFNLELKTFDCSHVDYNLCGNSVTNEIDNKLSITVNVTDVNDNPPKFEHKSMRIAIQTDTKKNETVENLTNKIKDDDDYLENKKNYFRVFNFKEHGEVSAQAQPFFVEKGLLKANQAFQAAEMGYIQFSIQVYDSIGQNDTAEMKVYVVGKANKIKISLLRSIQETQNMKDEFSRELSDILQNGIKIVPGKIEAQQSKDKKFEKRKTNMFIYGIQNNTIMLAKDLQDLIDMKTNLLSRFQDKFSVVSIMRLQKQTASSNTSSKNKVIFLAVIALLTVSLFAILLLFYASNQRYKRKLKAAKIDVHSNKQDLEKWIVPGSNVHALGQSNPIYNKEISPHTALPEKVSLNSLDMNEVGDSAVFVDPFDEQEIALDFMEDPNEMNNTFQDSSKTFLDNVIKEREAEMNKKNQSSGSLSGHTNMAMSVTSLETTDV